MDRTFYFIGIAFFGMINGLFNQFWLLFALIYMQQICAGPLFFGSVPLTLMFASLMVSTATIILGGIPAAIYERFIGVKAIRPRSRCGSGWPARPPDPSRHRQFPANRPLRLPARPRHCEFLLHRDRSQIGGQVLMA